MDYQNFCTYVKDNILNYLPEQYAESSVSVESTMKNNGVVRQGLTIRVPDCNISPVMYLEESYRQYDMGISIETVCREIADAYQRHIIMEAPVKLDDVIDFDKVKPNITMKLLVAKTNKSLLLERPATRIDDFAVFYQIELVGMGDGRATIPVTKELFHGWGIALSELHKIAVNNTEKLFPSKLMTMESALFGEKEDLFLAGEYMPTELPMLILTNKEMNGGACAIVNPDVLDKVSKLLNDSFYIIPSSVHETIILPKESVKNMGMGVAELGAMVREVNGNEVSREEQLSDHIYEYDKNQRKLETVRDSREKVGKEHER